MVSHILQKSLGEKFREEQRFLLVSIETNSDQEGRGFLSSVQFCEAGSALGRASVKSPELPWLGCAVPGPVELERGSDISGSPGWQRGCRELCSATSPEAQPRQNSHQSHRNEGHSTKQGKD